MSETDSPAGDSAEDDVIDALRLCSIPGVGPRTRKKLLERFGSDRAVLEATRSELREVEGVGPKLAEQISGGDHQADVEREIAICRQHGIEILTERQDAYPRMLR